MVKDLKEETDIMKILKILTQSDICLWEIMKERIKKFFKYKCKLLNQEQNEKYREPMTEYVDLQTKADKTDDDIHNLVI